MLAIHRTYICYLLEIDNETGTEREKERLVNMFLTLTISDIIWVIKLSDPVSIRGILEVWV
jgi:hypothetical protein